MKHSPLTKYEYFAPVHNGGYDRWWAGRGSSRWAVVWDRYVHYVTLKHRVLLDGPTAPESEGWSFGPFSYYEEERGKTRRYYDREWTFSYHLISPWFWWDEFMLWRASVDRRRSAAYTDSDDDN